MKRVWLLSLVVLTLQAGLLDFVSLQKAQKAYRQGDYEQAARIYEKLAPAKGDAAWLDAGDAWYKKGDYAKAAKAYEKVKDPSLAFQKWHNLGNTYAHMGQIDQGIAAYEKALRIKDDPDTRHNLQLLKQLKRKRQKDRDRKNRQQKKNSQGKGQPKSDKQQNKGQSQSNDQNNQQSQKSQKGTSNQAKPQNHDKRSGEPKERRGQRSKGDERKQKHEKARKREGEKKGGSRRQGTQARSDTSKKTSSPISDMELRKWERSLERRQIHTLMLPMPTKPSKRSDDATNPW